MTTSSVPNCLISIIVPTYNDSQYLDRCIDSILKQYYENFELIIVDDGSEQIHISHIVELISQKDDPRIRVIFKDHSGAGDTRNIGIHNAQGEYLCFVDADDTVDPTYTLSLLTASLKFNADVAICGRKTWFEGNQSNDCPNREYLVDSCEAVLDIINKKNNSYIAVAKLYKTSYLKQNKILFPASMLYEDMVFSFYSVSQTNRIVYVPDPAYNYFVRWGSRSMTLSGQMFIDYSLALGEVIKCLINSQKLPSLKSDINLFILESTYRICKWIQDDINNEYIDCFKICALRLTKITTLFHKSSDLSIDLLEYLNSFL